MNTAIRAHLDPSRLQIAIIGPNGAALADAIGSEAASPMSYEVTVPEEVLAVDRIVATERIGIARDHITVIPADDVFR